MTNMNDRDLVLADAIIDYVWITSEPQRANVEFFDQSMPFGKVLKAVDAFLNKRFHLARRAWVAFVEVFENRLAIGKRSRGISNSHIPWRLFASATISSGTNSPRSACANPSRMAARVSSSSGTAEASESVIDSIAKASASCSSSGSVRTFAIA